MEMILPVLKKGLKTKLRKQYDKRSQRSQRSLGSSDLFRAESVLSKRWRIVEQLRSHRNETNLSATNNNHKFLYYQLSKRSNNIEALKKM